MAEDSAEDDVAEAKAVCRVCDVRDDCLREALQLKRSAGIWGGLTLAERQDLLGGAG